ncbi:tudor domain-containing protein 7-like isoform X4 [Dermacentor variabilis]|uniref:tudor domain-containing protein 7-like isoform X4 n=1 Tax=Dermacentor variabilis TaxID=34621 RepID=UPI003F5C84B7
MGTESMEDVGTILRSILTSEKSGILLRFLDNEYRTLTGTRIPYRQMGFSTLEEYLHSIPDVARLSTNAEGNTVVHVVVSESTAHVAQMVRGQKSAKTRPVLRKSYRRPSGQYNAGYRPNHLLSKLTRSRPPPTSSGVYGRNTYTLYTIYKRRPGYELYHPPQQRSFGTTSTRPVQNSHNWSRKSSTTSQSSDIAVNDKTTHSSFASQQPRATYQTPPRFQKATHSASSSRSPSKGREGWGKESEPRAVTSVVARQPSTDASFKQSENKHSSWQELDNSWSKSTYKPSTRSAAEFWEFGAGDTGKQPLAPSQTTTAASEASRAAAVEEEDEIPVRGKHFTVDDVSIPQTPNCQLVLAYAHREGLAHSYSTMQDRSQRKKGPAAWLATLRLGERRFPSYPEEKATQDEAKETAAARAVAELGLRAAAVATYPVTPVSSAEEIAVLIDRITSLVLSKPHGILKEGVEALYKENYSEQLPGSWFEHLVRSELVHIERGSRCILYPRGGSDRSSPVQQNGCALSIDWTSSPSSSTGEPSTNVEYLDVFVSCVSSTASVCFRFVEYEAAYEKLLEEMATFFNSGAGTKGVVSLPKQTELYATFHDERWLRVQPLKDAENGKVECWFVDEGNNGLIPVGDLWELPERFAELAQQAIGCQLDGLLEYADCDGIVDILSDLLLGKNLVAEILQREDPVSVILYDTWGPDDVNMNDMVHLSLMKPRLPEKGCVGRCYLSHVTDSGVLWIQVKGPGFETLNNFMTAVNDYCKRATSMVDDPVANKVYGCLSRSDHAFYRSVLLSPEPLPSGEFQVLHVDYGYEERCYLSEFRNVDSLGDFVLRLPFQAVPCRLRGLTEEDCFCWSQDISTQVLNLSGGHHVELLIRVTKPSIDAKEPVVELFRRNEESRELISINNTVIEALKQTRCPGLH